MADLIKAETRPSLEDKYRLLNRLIDAALFRWHPDHNKSEQAGRMTRGLLRAKQQAREAYHHLKDEQP